MDVNDPEWTKKFSEWTCRKAAHYGMGPFEFMGRALGMGEGDIDKARRLDNRPNKTTPQP